MKYNSYNNKYSSPSTITAAVLTTDLFDSCETSKLCSGNILIQIKQSYFINCTRETVTVSGAVSILRWVVNPF